MSPSSTSAARLRPTDAFEDFRAHFPAAASRAYLDVASRSLVPASAMTIATEHIAERMEGRVNKQQYFEMVESARLRFARMIGAHPDEIAITKNVSEGLNIMAGAIDWKSWDEVLLCSAIEHPNNIYPWRNLENQGVRVRDLPSPDGLFPLAQAKQLLAERGTRVVSVPSTSFRPGFRTDLDALAAACEEAGAMLIVDGAQSAGIMHLDVRRTPISALAVSTQKGLCGLYGMGFLYVRRDLAERLTPRALARFGVQISATHEADYDPGPIEYRRGALRFDLGNYNFLAAALVDDAMALLEGCGGTQAIQDYTLGLGESLAAGLSDCGAPVVRPAGALGSNIVSLSFAGRAEAAKSLQAWLASQQVYAAVRGSTLRFSLHAYNNADDVEQAVRATASWTQRGDAAR
ncbi:aminotransferase class V-fold PLP-dependent enzyme [Bordetella genomosp. 13]|uniref:aminotransferase class V-fold PLP-dependent enzyme n=1 Tax=Bordetella genomosp. 13 TaxID=463040 RepID=UPI0016429A21|nr:aminotransferase class V-fold PLP-dependent enzyme [Bordetella genomosp. 13]